MANSKNTIQNIPLNGTLNMNTLKTDVKRFEGFNEKNSTVFGGTLSPYYNKKSKTNFGDYVFYNSKGEDYRFLIDSTTSDHYVKVYKGDNLLGQTGLKYTYKLDLPSNAVWGDLVLYKYSMSIDGKFFTFTNKILMYITDDKKLWVKYILPEDEDREAFVRPPKLLCELPFIPDTTVSLPGAFGASVHTSSNIRVPIMCAKIKDISGWSFFMADIFIDRTMSFSEGSGYYQDIRFTCHTHSVDSLPGSVYLSSTGNNPLITTCCRENTGLVEIYIVSKQGVIKKDDELPIIVRAYFNYANEELKTFDTTDWFVPQSRYYSIIRGTTTEAYPIIKKTSQEETFEINQFAFRECVPYGSSGKFDDSAAKLTTYYYTQAGKLEHNNVITGHDGYGIIPSPLRSNFYHNYYMPIYYLNGELLSIVDKTTGIPINTPTNFDNNIVSYNYHTGSVTYKSNNNWYTYSPNIIEDSVNNVKDLLKKLIIDNRYIIMDTQYDSTSNSSLYDIETDDFVRNSMFIGFIDDYIPRGPSASTELTSVVYGGGYNAGYEIENDGFVGYLSNPYLVTNCPKNPIMETPIPDTAIVQSQVQVGSIQQYLSFGNNVRSAQYVGKNVKYKGTTISINSENNIILPISLNSIVLKGYSNNDLIVVNSKAFPLIYQNINNKLYSYYLLSFMENIEGAFSLQGQTYTFDKDNIYATTYNSGIIQDSKAVCYKKNMTFLGTLPTQAIFWSAYNKTFYSFTGDRVLTKMFEASDINKINYVGQNPASLSLWVCTDKGIYIISDTDMHKLDFISDRVFFLEDKVDVLTTVDNEIELNEISLYDINNGAEPIPVKLKTAYYGLGSEQKAVMDCWYIRLYDEKRTECDIKVKCNTITDVTRKSEEKIFHINAYDYDDNNIYYIRYQPKYQECTAMQLELESPIGIYELAIGVNATDTTAQVSKFNF